VELLSIAAKSVEGRRDNREIQESRGDRLLDENIEQRETAQLSKAHISAQIRKLLEAGFEQRNLPR
jgi:hypothetical protein